MYALLQENSYFAIAEEKDLKAIKTDTGHNLAYALLMLESSMINNNQGIAYQKVLNKNNLPIYNFFQSNTDLFYEIPNVPLMPSKEGMVEVSSAKPAIFLAPIIINSILNELKTIHGQSHKNEFLSLLSNINNKLSFYENLEFNKTDSLGIPLIIDTIKDRKFLFIDWIINLDKKLLTEDYSKNKKIIETVKPLSKYFEASTFNIEQMALFNKLLAKLEKENLELMLTNKEEHHKTLKI